ncbi:MAG: autoinducer binding domain-containing protein [Pseudomonadota bacterium]|nr:LuxR family transcriptional regulator [Alphaproteobacteria bacterium]
MLAHALEKINQEFHSKEEILSVFKDICLNFGFEYFALTIFHGINDIKEKFFSYNTYPEAWVKYVIEERQYLNSPIFISLKKAARPFSWHTTSFQNLTLAQQNYMNIANDFGVKWGETIPLIPHEEYHGFITISNAPPVHPEVFYIIQHVANICVDKIVPLFNDKAPRSLSSREYEILMLKSEGLAIKKISNYLDLSISTINFHLKNIRGKLDAHSTEQALVKFTTMGALTFGKGHG